MNSLDVQPFDFEKALISNFATLNGIFKVAISGIWLPLCTKRRFIRVILNHCVILKYRPLSTAPFDPGFSLTEIFYRPLSPITVHLDLVGLN